MTAAGWLRRRAAWRVAAAAGSLTRLAVQSARSATCWSIVASMYFSTDGWPPGN